MPVPFGDAYRGAHARLAARVQALAASDPATLATPVPACPAWSVHGVLSHLAGLAVDATSGRISGIPDDAWTAAQVADRAGTPTADVVAEWAGAVDDVVAALEERRMPPNIAADALVHEADVAEALGDPMPPPAGWAPAAEFLCRSIVGRASGPGTLVVHVAGDEWTGGSGDGSRAAVSVEPYELFRGLFSRRSRAQMSGWSWAGDAAPWIEALPVFGPRDDDQPRPTA